MVVIMAYLLLIASDQYVSEGSIIISEERSSSSNVDLSFLGLSNSAADNDALVLKSFVLSKDMLAFLNEKLSIRAHYGAGAKSTMSPNSTAMPRRRSSSNITRTRFSWNMTAKPSS